MNVIILIAIILVLLSVWALGYTYTSARSNIQRHEAWHAKKKQELCQKVQSLTDQEATLQARIHELEGSN